MGFVRSALNPEETQHSHLDCHDGMDDFALLIEIVELKGTNMEKQDDVDKAEPSDSDETDRPSIPQPNAAAEAGAGESDSDQQRREVVKHYKEMVELGANIKGEGEIE